MIMIGNDIDEEIGKLKARKVEITNKMNLITSFDEKEELQEEIKRIQKQIDTLEKFK